MSRSLLPVLVAAALSAPMSTSPLRAQEAEGRFAALLEEGLRLREQGQDAAALAVFEECVELRPESGQAIGQVGFAEMALGRLVLAEAHLNSALAFEGDDWVVRHRRTLEEATASLRARIATVEVRGEGEVSFVESGQSETRRTPVTLRLSPGRHELHVTSPGFEPTMSVIRVEPGQRMTHVPARRPSSPMMAPDALVSATDGHGPLIMDEGAQRYRRRSIRLDVFAGLFATGSIGTGIAALATRPSSADDHTGRSTANQVLVGTAISAAVAALVLFVSARTARVKYRRQVAPPVF